MMETKKLSLDRTTLKIIAVIAMAIDHVAAEFLVGLTVGELGWIYYVCRFIGRMTAPIMCFFLSEGFIHTSSRKNYIIRMGIFALIAQPVYTLAFFDKILTLHFSMIFTLFISLLMLEAWEKIDKLPLRILAVIICVLLTIRSDWAIYAPLMVFGCYIMRDRGIYRLTVPAAVSLYMVAMYGISFASIGRRFWGAFMHLGMVVSVILLAFYNGERGRGGKASKWFFYIFYPTHLLIIYIAKLLLRG